MAHKIVIRPRIELLEGNYTYKDTGNLVFRCSCGHEVQILLQHDRNWPLLLATCGCQETITK